MEKMQSRQEPGAHALGSGGVPDVDEAGAEQLFQKHEALLRDLAGSFGFHEREAQAILAHVHGCARAHWQQRNLPVRLWLVRLGVHHCVMKIGNELCCRSGSKGAEIPSDTPGFFYRNCRAGELRLQQMPLSLRAVYILVEKMGFSEEDTADLLSTTPYTVRERRCKALCFLKHLREADS